MTEETTSIPHGYCRCGCGQKTNISRWGDKRVGRVKGEPNKYIFGHTKLKLKKYEIDPTTGCWNWLLYTGRNGYGNWFDNGKQNSAHTLFWERKYGPVPAGKVLDHLCRNKRCVNPDHLEPVTNAENVRRGFGASKLTMEKANEIRRLYRGGNVTQAKLGIMFSVSSRHVSAIVNGKKWAAA